MLDYDRAENAVRLLDDDEKGQQILRTPGGMQKLNLIGTPGLLKLIQRGNKPAVKRFDRGLRMMF